MANPPNKQRYINEFNRKSYQSVSIKLNKTTDKPLLDFLDSVDNKTEFVRQAILNEMKKRDGN